MDFEGAPTAGGHRNPVRGVKRRQDSVIPGNTQEFQKFPRGLLMPGNQVFMTDFMDIQGQGLALRLPQGHDLFVEADGVVQTCEMGGAFA